MASVKALVQVDAAVHALSGHSQILIKKQTVNKWLSSKRCQFVKKCFYSIKVQCVYIVYPKYQMASIKALVGVDFLAHVLSSIIQNYKGQ